MPTMAACEPSHVSMHVFDLARKSGLGVARNRARVRAHASARIASRSARYASARDVASHGASAINYCYPALISF